jgi:hypothetical protein
MAMYPVKRTPEQGHEKECLAKAIICAVENVRDYEDETAHDFRLSAQDNYFLTLADEYLREGITECICPD